MNQLFCPYCDATLNNVQRDIHFNGELAPNPKDNSTGECPYCKHYPSLHFVQSYFVKGMFVKTVMELTLFKESAREDKRYRIECYPGLGQTYIFSWDEGNVIFKTTLVLSGCPINPKNAQNKLKLYLCLS